MQSITPLQCGIKALYKGSHASCTGLRGLRVSKTPARASQNLSSFLRRPMRTFPAFVGQNRSNTVLARFYSNGAPEQESPKTENREKVIKIVSGPDGGQREPTAEELKAMLMESERRKGLILNFAIAAFILADVLLLGFWYLSSEEDENSASYVPSDWKHLVLSNLGISTPQTVPSQYIGEWKSSDGASVYFEPRGAFGRAEPFAGGDPSSPLKLQSSGTIFAADPESITVKTTTVERIKVSSPPTMAKDGSWEIILDGKTYKKRSGTRSL